MNITEKEKEMIINIAENLYSPLNGGVPKTFEDTGPVWSNCLDQVSFKNNIPLASIPGRMASLIKKGLAESDDYDPKENCTWLTKEGFEVYQSFGRQPLGGIMIIMKKWNDTPERLKGWDMSVSWFRTTQEEFIKHTEHSGHYIADTALIALSEGLVLRTPTAFYKAIKEI